MSSGETPAVPPGHAAPPGAPLGPSPTATRPAPVESSVLPAADAPVVPADVAIVVPDDVRLFGTDLDGTLLDPTLQVGARAQAALPRLVTAGVPVVYVTGRPPRWLAPVVAQTGVAGFAVCGNGSLVVDLARQRLVRATPIGAEQAHAVVAHLRAAVPGITFAVERLVAEAVDGFASTDGVDGLTVFGMEASYHPLWGRPPEAEVADIATLIDRGPVLKLLAIPPDDSGHDNDSLVALALGHDQVHVTHSGARNALIEVTAGGADKGAGFLAVAEALGIDPAYSVGVGDMPNDVPLIHAAGTGYAVANAHVSVRAAADHVLPSNVDDGVGRLLEAILATRSR